jgi:hypothetical protein
MAVLLSLGLISHSPRSQQERTRQEDRYFKFYELRDNLGSDSDCTTSEIRGASPLWHARHPAIAVDAAAAGLDLLYAVVTGQRNHEDSRRKGLASAAGRRQRPSRSY